MTPYKNTHTKKFRRSQGDLSEPRPNGEVLVTLMVTSPVLLASSWEQVSPTSFERLGCFGPGVIGMEWNSIAKKNLIFFKSF